MRNDPVPHYPADATEHAIPDADAAAALLLSRRPELMPWLMRWQRGLLETFGAGILDDAIRAAAALGMALARMGLRHGSWGQDFHAYHNENHALELLDGRLDKLTRDAGDALSGRDWIALALFSACHDLRQREVDETDGPVGANEWASYAESTRILDAAGFSTDNDRWLYRTLELAIAGSTFDASPLPPASRHNTAELAAHGGPFAPRLGDWLDEWQPGWRNDPVSTHALELAQIASDLDTANVAEPLLELVASSIRLCEEREMRAGRSLSSTESAEHCLGFLTAGQERYFFELHRFCSDLGRDTFAPGKAENAAPLHALVGALRESRPDGPLPRESGMDIIRHFARLALHHSG